MLLGKHAPGAGATLLQSSAKLDIQVTCFLLMLLLV